MDISGVLNCNISIATFLSLLTFNLEYTEAVVSMTILKHENYILILDLL